MNLKPEISSIMGMVLAFFHVMIGPWPVTSYFISPMESFLNLPLKMVPGDLVIFICPKVFIRLDDLIRIQRAFFFSQMMGL